MPVQFFNSNYKVTQHNKLQGPQVLIHKPISKVQLHACYMCLKPRSSALGTIPSGDPLLQDPVKHFLICILDARKINPSQCHLSLYAANISLEQWCSVCSVIDLDVMDHGMQQSCPGFILIRPMWNVEVEKHHLFIREM